MDKYKFGEYIYNKRKSLGLTQDELGRKLGVTNKAVSKWEVGETFPDITMLAPLAKTLGVSVDELLNYTDNKKENLTPKKNKINLITLIISIVLFVALIITFILYIAAVSKGKNDGTITLDVNNENIKEIIDINPSSKIVCDGETLIIDSTYMLNDQYKFDENNNLAFTVVYQFEYYYYLKDGSTGIVTYYNRFYDITLNSSKPTESISILLEPKFDINDFKGFNQVKISYIVLDAEGSVDKVSIVPEIEN